MRKNVGRHSAKGGLPLPLGTSRSSGDEAGGREEKRKRLAVREKRTSNTRTLSLGVHTDNIEYRMEKVVKKRKEKKGVNGFERCE